jgi:hypothetical protein
MVAVMAGQAERQAVMAALEAVVAVLQEELVRLAVQVYLDKVLLAVLHLAVHLLMGLVAVVVQGLLEIMELQQKVVMGERALLQA